MTTIKNRQEATAWQNRYDSLAPKVGDLAPDFELLDIQGENSIRLNDFQGSKPVALIFGSFTWPPYVQGTVSLHSLYKEFSNQVQFIKIYIREAHPVDGWWFGKGFMRALLKLSGSKATRDLYDPKTLQERRAAAGDCEQSLQYGIKTYVDEMDDRVNKAYAAWPTRLYLINKEWIVIYAGGLGPFGFKPGALKQAIQKHITKE